VNAAYLMLTTAWLAGQNPAPPAAAAPAAPAPAPVAAAPVVSTSMGACNGGYAGYGAYGGCGGGCGAAADNCGCERQRLCDRLKGMFHRRGHGDCGCEGGAVGGSGCGCAGGAWGGSGYGGGVIGAPATGAPAEAIPAQPKPGEAPKKMPSTPMTMNGVIHDVTPVATPRLGIEQEGPRQPF
jgi:hypothetical protein